MKDLYPHNKRAYEKVMQHFANGNRKAAVVQCTGTGKSFVGGAVAEHFNKTLVLAPNLYVLEQASSANGKVHTMTYPYLAIQEDMPKDLDLIWLDEFHRVGAKTWGEGVERLIEMNPQAKILGTTATPIRALEQKDMADVLFRGDVVSEMNLSDAWCEHILKTPTYVIGITEFDSTSRDYIARINGNKLMDDKVKKEAIAKVNNIARNWKLAGGVTNIFRKYVDKDVRRMIVFSPSVNQVESIKSCIHTWLTGANINHYKTYFVHHNARTNKKNFEEFTDDNYEGVKVMIAVDMLNEGIHVPNVDCVLLRSTISKNLYMQQIGRCFSIGNKHKPIVLDLADNLSSANGYNEIYSAKKRYDEETTHEVSGYTDDDNFTITDEIKDVRELMSEIDNMLTLYSTNEKWDVMLPIIRAEYERLGHLPTKEENYEVCMYIRGYKRPEIQANHPNRIEILASMGFDPIVHIDRRPYEVRLAELDEEIARSGQLPKATTKNGQFMRNSFKNPKYRQDMIDRGFSLKYTLMSDEEKRAYILENKSMPTDKENKSLRGMLRNYCRKVMKDGEDKEIIAIIEEYGLYREPQCNLLDKYEVILEEFVKKENRFPTNSSNDKTNNQEALNALRYIKGHKQSYIDYLIETYDLETLTEFKQRKFFEWVALAKKYNGKPKDTRGKSQEECSVASWLTKMRSQELEQWQIDALTEVGVSLERCDSKAISIIRAKEFVAYVNEHGKYPTTENPLYNWRKGFLGRGIKEGETYEILKSVGAHVFIPQKILSRDVRMDIIKKFVKGEKVEQSKETIAEWRRDLYKNGTDEQRAKLDSLGFVRKRVKEDKIVETCKKLDEYLTQTNVKVIRKKDNPLSKMLCRVMQGDGGTDEARKAYQAILDKHGAKLYTIQTQWMENFERCYALMKSTGFYPRKRIKSEDRMHDWLVAQRNIKYPSLKPLEHLLYEHNMIYPNIESVRRPNIPWEDKNIYKK